MNPLVLSFVENLRTERAKTGLKQREVADKLNINRSTYSYYENLQNPHLPDLETIYKIADIFGISVSKLLPESLNEGITLCSQDPSNTVKEVPLTIEEQRLISVYRSCSDEQKKQITLSAINISLDDCMSSEKKF